MKFFHFLTYNNAVPIAITLLLVGGATTFAATNPDAILASQQKVLSVDNTYLVNKDLATYSPRAIINGVSEDSDYYYVDYSLSTIDVSDSVWKDVSRGETMKVSKPDLGPYRDLGVYVTEQLRQIIARESQRLVETQQLQSKHVSQKVVATEYSGLIGKFLDETTETLPGYTPVVQPPPPPPTETASAGASAPPTSSVDTSSSSPGPSPSNPPPPVSNGNGPTIQILGNNPARINVGDRYADLGAVADTGDLVNTFLNNVQVQAVSIDTSAAGTWTVRYEATGKNGGTSSAERTVIVTDPFAGQRTAAPEATTTLPESTTTSL